MSEFDKNNLAAHLALPAAVRPLALMSALRFVAGEDMLGDGVSREDLAALERSRLAFRFELQRRLTSAERTDVFALRRRGAVALAEAVGADPDAVPSETGSSCRRSAMFLDHSLARGRFALSLARALTVPGGPALASWEQDHERLEDAVDLPAGTGAIERQPLVADGLATVLGPRGPEGLLVEIDRGTERPGYLGRKYRGYLEWWRTGGPERKFGLRALRLLTVAPDARRTAKLADACRESTAGRAKGLFWFASEEDLAREGVLGPAWLTMAEERLRLWQ